MIRDTGTDSILYYAFNASDEHGNALSFIVALVGILNFLNTILTGIATHRRKFAVLQMIGITGRQLLNVMLILEGLLYTVGAITLVQIWAYICPILVSWSMRKAADQTSQ